MIIKMMLKTRIRIRMPTENAKLDSLQYSIDLTRLVGEPPLKEMPSLLIEHELEKLSVISSFE